MVIRGRTMIKKFDSILDARIFLVNTEIDLFNDETMDDIDYDEAIDNLLQEKIENKEFIIKGEWDENTV